MNVGLFLFLWIGVFLTVCVFMMCPQETYQEHLRECDLAIQNLTQEKEYEKRKHEEAKMQMEEEHERHMNKLDEMCVNMFPPSLCLRPCLSWKQTTLSACNDVGDSLSPQTNRLTLERQKHKELLSAEQSERQLAENQQAKAEQDRMKLEEQLKRKEQELEELIEAQKKLEGIYERALKDVRTISVLVLIRIDENDMAGSVIFISV